MQAQHDSMQRNFGIQTTSRIGRQACTHRLVAPLALFDLFTTGSVQFGQRCKNLAARLTARGIAYVLQGMFRSSDALQGSASTMPTSVRQRGAFILFEGLDRSGKSTQCRRLVESLTRKQVP